MDPLKVYQNIEIDGIDFGERTNRKNSQFYNRGKWDNFINPLLPLDCSGMTFVELGCNAGLFLKLALEKGFKNIIGIEKSRKACKIGEKYRKKYGLNYKIINSSICKDFNFDTIPVTDLILLANFHYSLKLDDLLFLLDKLKNKVCYCLVVSVNDEYEWIPDKEIDGVRKYFSDWKETKAIVNFPPINDLCYRNMYSLLFKSSLEKKNISDIEIVHSHIASKKMYLNSVEVLAHYINNSIEFDIEDTDYYKFLFETKKHKWSKDTILQHINSKIALMKDIKLNGLKEPIIILKDGFLYDGLHRLKMMKELGYKNITVRIHEDNNLLHEQS